MLYDDDPIIERRVACQGKDREPREPSFHIEAYADAPQALCGYTFGPGNYEAPWHEGSLDCAECWRLEHDLEAEA